MRFIQTSFTLGPIWLAKIMLHKKMNLLVQSENFQMFQACLVPNVTNVPGIPGPYFYQSSTHTWSLLWPSFQAYLVPFIINVPGIPGPYYYRCSLHTQSPPIQLGVPIWDFNLGAEITWLNRILIVSFLANVKSSECKCGSLGGIISKFKSSKHVNPSPYLNSCLHLHSKPPILFRQFRFSDFGKID